MNQSNWKEALSKQLWEEQSPTNRYKEQLRRMVLIEEGLAKNSKKQHLENTDK